MACPVNGWTIRMAGRCATEGVGLRSCIHHLAMGGIATARLSTRGIEMKRSRLNEGLLLLSALSADLSELGKNTSAAYFSRWANELQNDLDRKQLLKACRNIIHALDNGPGRIPDLYFAFPDGTPDVKRTEQYLDNILAVRRFAQRAAPPWSYFIF
jgi:hypothetical protein